MKKKKIKFIINILVILVVLGIVLYFSLKDYYQEIMDAILHMNFFWIFLAVLALLGYRFCASYGHYLVIRENHEKVSIWRCLQINFIILFFHGVTPFAGGGQPMEVYFLHNEGIPVTKAANITLQNFIVYQIALVITGIFALFYNMHFQLFPNDHLIKKLVVLGFLINLAVLVITFLLSFGKKFNRLVCEKGIHLLSKFHLIREEEKVQKQFSEYLANFHANALQLQKSKLAVLKMVGANLLGLFILYSMPYAVIRGMGLDFHLFPVVVATAYVMIIGSFVPIPGGTGGIEYGFIFFFGYFISGSILHAVMLVWRFISYYLGIIVGAIVLSLYRKKERECE